MDKKLEELKKQIVAEFDKKIDIAIEERKKQVAKQFKVWGAAISATFSFLVIIGITFDDIKTSIRNTLLPTEFIVNNLVGNDIESKTLKRDIINELNDPDFEEYPDVGESLKRKVWNTINNAEDNEIEAFLRESSLDDKIIRKHHKDVTDLLYGPTVYQSDRDSIVSKIKEYSEHISDIKIGFFENEENQKTNCVKRYYHHKKLVILHFPPSSKKTVELENGKEMIDALAWYRCPTNGYPTITVTLSIDDIKVEGVRVVGVERPATEDSSRLVKGVRARVSRAVLNEFEQNGIDITSGVSSGYIKLDDVFY